MHAQTIYKYPLRLTDVQTINLPIGGRILHVGMQHGVITLWAIVDGEKPRVDREIYIFGTGHPIRGAKHLNYLGTVNAPEDGTEFIWHVFESV